MEKLSVILKKLLSEEGISEAELARRTNIAQPMINRLVTGININPKLKTLMPLAKYFKITFSQLLGEEPLPAKDERNIRDQQANNGSKNNSTNNLESSWKEVPVLEWEQVNNFLKDNQNKFPVEFMPTDMQVSLKSFAVRIKDKCFEPRFTQGSVLVIEPQMPIKDLDFVLVSLDNSITIKRVEYHNEQLYLVDLNNFQKQVWLEKNRILGVLVQVRYSNIAVA